MPSARGLTSRALPPLVAAVILAGALVALLPTAAAATPTFSGTVPDLEVTAGRESYGVYDVSPHFSDPDNGTIHYTAHYVNAPHEWDVRIFFNGSWIEVVSGNESAWGHGILFTVRANTSASGGYAESNTIQLNLAPPPVGNRTWVERLNEGSSSLWVDPGCVENIHYRPMLFPTDGVVVSFTFDFWRSPIPAPDPGTDWNGTTPPGWSQNYSNTSAWMEVRLGAALLANITLTDNQTAYELDTGPLNQAIQAAAGEMAATTFVLNITSCVAGDPLYVHYADPTVLILRMPPGTDLSNLSALNPSLPTAGTPIPDWVLVPGENPDFDVNLDAYFHDDDGDPLTYEVHIQQAPDDFADHLALRVSGAALHAASTDPEWNGSVVLNISARDPFGARVFGSAFEVRVEPALPNGTGGGDGGANTTALPDFAGILADGVALGTIVPDAPHTFALDALGALPQGTEVLWFLDGNPVGQGPVLSDVSVPAGTHVLEARITLGVETRTLSAPFTAVPTGNPTGTRPSAPADGGVLAVSLAVAAVTAVALLGLTERGQWLVLVGALGTVFARLRRDSLLDHFARGRIYQVIEENPGIHLAEIVRRTGLAKGSATHHLATLEKGGYVRVVADGTRTCFFTADRSFSEETYGLSDRDRELLVRITDRPGSTQAELAGDLRRSASSVSRGIARLAKLGFVRTSRGSRGVFVYPIHGRP